jgi:EamA domain-containing membrane protein RarD
MVVTTRARKQEPTSLADLHSAMDAEDKEFCFAMLNDHEVRASLGYHLIADLF